MNGQEIRVCARTAKTQIEPAAVAPFTHTTCIILPVQSCKVNPDGYCLLHVCLVHTSQLND